MQKMIRWQVEAVKSEITGVVFGFRIVTLRWERETLDAKWEKLNPNIVEQAYSIYSGSLDDLWQKEYLKLLKINFYLAFRKMNRLASKLISDGNGKVKIQHSKIGLNWCEYIYEEYKDELDRRAGNENRVSDDSEITCNC
jgi:hypothetical protein